MTEPELSNVRPLFSKQDRFPQDGLSQARRHVVLDPGQPSIATSRRPLNTSGFRPYKVSAVGQMTVPASARQRWGLRKGGTVEVADLGFAVVILPRGGTDVVRENLFPQAGLEREARRLLSESQEAPVRRSGAP